MLDWFLQPVLPLASVPSSPTLTKPKTRLLPTLLPLGLHLRAPQLHPASPALVTRAKFSPAWTHRPHLPKEPHLVTVFNGSGEGL